MFSYIMYDDNSYKYPPRSILIYKTLKSMSHTLIHINISH